MQGGSTGQAEIAAAIERLNREIARILSMEHLLLGSSSSGSFAMSKDKSDNLGQIIEGTMQELRSTFDKDVIDPIWDLNGWDPKLKPTFKTESVQKDITQVTTALLQMAQAGAVLAPDDPVINEVRDLLGLSQQETISLAGDVSLSPKKQASKNPQAASGGKGQGKALNPNGSLQPGPGGKAQGPSSGPIPEAASLNPRNKVKEQPGNSRGGSSLGPKKP